MFCIDGVGIDRARPPYLIAEMSANHNGSLERALATIDAAKSSGANAIKLQTYTADSMTRAKQYGSYELQAGIWKGSNLHDLYSVASTPYEWHRHLFQRAAAQGITIFSSPFDESALELLEELNAPAYKISSFELVDLPLIQLAAATGKPLILSTGMATDCEIHEALSCARSAGCEDLAILHCISNYPTPIAECYLGNISHLAETFGVPVGFSDHTVGVAAASAAVALGAVIVEKHFALDDSENGIDAAFSIDPLSFRNLRRQCDEVWQATRSFEDDQDRPDFDSRKLRRSVYYNRSLPAGHQLVTSDLVRLRPAEGLSPQHISSIIGSTLKVNVAAGQPVAWEHLG